MDLGSDPALRAGAALGALRCAIRLGDDKEIDLIAAVWSTLSTSGDHLAVIIELCKGLVASGKRAAAVKVAAAEEVRVPRARAAYLLGRCSELAGYGDGAFAAFGRAIERAEQEPGAADVASAARGRRLSEQSAMTTVQATQTPMGQT